MGMKYRWNLGGSGDCHQCRSGHALRCLAGVEGPSGVASGHYGQSNWKITILITVNRGSGKQLFYQRAPEISSFFLGGDFPGHGA